MADSLISRGIRRTPLRWLLPNHLWRMEAIQCAIDALAATCYLEIGVSSGLCFSTLSARRKIGVDPLPAQPLVVAEIQKPGVSYFALTSDEFFRQAAPQVLGQGVDVVFIDGLHTAEQAYRDCLSALEYLAPGGIILLHDCLPASAAEAVVASSYDEAWKLNGLGWNGEWTGDVWKAVVRLRTLHPDLETFVIHSDHGIGVVRRARNRAPLAFTEEQIGAMRFSDLARDAQRLLGLCPPHHFRSTLRRLRAERGRSSS